MSKFLFRKSMACSSFCLLFLIGIASFPYCASQSEEGVIIRKLMNGYSEHARPVKMANMSVKVKFGLRLNTLLNLAMKEQTMHTILWLTLVWRDRRLTWNPAMFNGTSEVSIPTHKLWIPDIVLYNSADGILSSSSERMKTKVTVTSKGSCTLIAPAKFNSMCLVKVKNFPYDLQRCHMIFGSWTLDIRKLEIEELPTTASYLSEQFSSNGQWKLKRINTIIEKELYSCCANEFSQMKATFIFERKPLFFLLYLILPCLLISVLILLVFVIPPASGERLGLGITVILNMSVYLLVVSDHLPQSSDESPVLGVYYVMMIYEMTIAFILSGITLWISTWQIEMPEKVKYLFFKLPKKMKAQHKCINVTPNINARTISTRHLANSKSFEEESTDLDKIKISNKEALVNQASHRKQTWEQVGRKLDKFFFVFFFLLFLLTSVGVVLVKPDVGYGHTHS